MLHPRPTRPALAAALLFAALVAPPAAAQTPLELVLTRGRQLLELGDLEGVGRESVRALERDPNSIEAWTLRATWAERTGQRDEHVHALHRRLALGIQQGVPRATLDAWRAELAAVDPLSPELLALRDLFVGQLLPIADAYEKQGRRHSAIAVHREILVIDPERSASEEAIQRLASAPDPSLAADAKAKDLLEGVSSEWIESFDAKHAKWADRARYERDNYVTLTDAGYEVMVRAAEAMEQMNAFYRQFFDYGVDGGGVSRIELRIFRTRDEYLKHGSGPPVEWSGGQFTGASVETYIGPGGFQEMIGTLFHEAAHQFVSLATNASGWLNEGLASFFEGCRLLANGTVQMNLPANHRLFPLAERMERGWMSSHEDGIVAGDANAIPQKAPTFRVVLENRYEWGPPWYAPTWGVVYFLYNYQHPVDGRYLYRPAFREFIDKSGGRMGEGAVGNFEKVVLENPTPPTPGVDLAGASVSLPRTVEQLDPVWKKWILELRDEQSGRIEVLRPWHDWARYALRRKEYDVAAEHFEKGLVATPSDPALLADFAEFLAEHGNAGDRAVQMLVRAIALLEKAEPHDGARIAELDKRLAKIDTQRKALERVHASLHTAARSLLDRYYAAGLDLMTMELARGMAADLSIAGAEELYASAIARSGKTLSLWTLAYNEVDLRGWATADTEAWKPRGDVLEAWFGDYRPDAFDYQSLTLDTVTSGDFSFEAEVRVDRGAVAFAGLVFGRKSTDGFHAFLVFPPRGRDGAADTGYVDLTTFFGGGQYKIWRHTPVAAAAVPAGGTSSGVSWHKLRIDVVGPLVDVWFDGEYVATQEFQSVDVLRGNFGLVTGAGRSAFRNVRYLARDPRDAGAALERAKRLETLLASGAPPGGSYLGRVPPWPEGVRWVQGAAEDAPPASFADLGLGPKLLVLWSTEQNDLMPLHDWLAHLAEEWKDVGLRVVSIASPLDAERVEAYVAKHRFPDLVAVDTFSDDFGIGRTFTRYAIDKFNLPRLVLLDVDDEVVWEGDPGFALGERWKPGQPTYLDDPLKELVERHKLRELIPWRKRYAERAVPALADGRFLDALPILEEATAFDARRDAVVGEAQGRLAAARAAAEGWLTSAERLRESGATAALPTLLAWGEALGVAIDPRARRQHKDVLADPEAEAYAGVVAGLEKAVAAAKGRKPTALTGIERQLARVTAPFAEELRAALAALGDAPDAAALEGVLARARALPGAWLAREFFRWG